MPTKFVENTPLTVIDWVKNLKKTIPGFHRHNMPGYHLQRLDRGMAVVSFMENRFITAERPFFNVYPRVLEALLKTRLDIKPGDIPRSIIHDLPAIVVKLPVGSKIARTLNTDWFILSVFEGEPMKVLSAMKFNRLFGVKEETPFVAVYSRRKADEMALISTCVMDSTFADADYGGVLDRPEVEDGVAFFHKQPALVPDISVDALNLLCKIAMGVMLLAADPEEFLKPVILKADENRPHVPMASLVDKAKRRGVFGFTVGEDIERCPHFRRPHFAIRWTGKGSTVPKLVPVRGAIIGKEKLVTVPTGYESTSPPPSDGAQNGPP